MNELNLTLREQQLYELLQDDKSRKAFLARKRIAENEDVVNLWELIDHPAGFNEAIGKLKSSKYILYGAGTVCKKLVVYLTAIGVIGNCVGIWDKDPGKTDKEIGGIRVSLPNTTLDFEYALPAVSEKFRPELFSDILDFLQSIGVSDERIIKPYFTILESADEYFDEHIILPQLKDGEIFIDGGCYDFFTSKRFIEICGQRCVKIKAIHAFEPDENLAKKCRENSSGYPYSAVHQAGLWSENKELSFYTATESGSIKVGGSEMKINVVALDHYLPKDETVTFIKFDIEGAELEALQGTAEIIQRDKPKLAICIYHKPLDYLELTEYIHSLVPEYKMYIRFYGLGESVLYCIV